MACPVIQTSGGTSFIPGLRGSHLSLRLLAAAVEAVVKSDLCVALGTELGEPVHYGKTRHWAQNDANRKWIYVEQDPTAIGVNRPIDVALVGDLRGVVPQLVDALKDSPRSPSADLAPLDQTGCRPSSRELAETAPSGRTPDPPRALRGRGDQSVPGRTASWSATAARPSSSSGPTRRPSRTTSSGTRTSATSAPACPTPSVRRSPTAASGR